MDGIKLLEVFLVFLLNAVSPADQNVYLFICSLSVWHRTSTRTHF